MTNGTKEFAVFFKNREPMIIYASEFEVENNSNEDKVWIDHVNFYDNDGDLIASFVSEDIYGISLIVSHEYNTGGIEYKQLALPAP